MEIREIKFRGYNNDKMVYGNYALVDDRHWIIPFVDGEGELMDDWIRVSPESVGQFTGLKDKNGNEIYEGDIVLSIGDEDKNAMLIQWDERFASFCIDKKGWAFSHFFGEATTADKVEVIGNIYESPTLLK